jgi:hypothetical protein
MATPRNLRTQQLSTVDRAAIDNAAGSARLEGVVIPDSHKELAAAFLAGEIDESTYRARALAITGEDLGIEL